MKGCIRPHHSRGLCNNHAQLLRRHGTLEPTTEAERVRRWRESFHRDRVVQSHTYPKIGQRHAHRVVMEKKLGRALLSDEIVHHIDGNKQNVDPENLELMTRAQHIREHLPQLIAARKARAAARRQARGDEVPF